jgi:uncharacterized membrane protein
MYQVLVFVHVVSAVVWVGGAFFAQLLAIQVTRAGSPDELPTLGRRFEQLGTLVFVPAALLILASGLAMTTQRWSLGQPWIVAAILLWVLSAVAGSAYVAPRMRQAGTIFESEGADSPAARQLVDRVFLVSRLELGSFAVILGLMVFKPGL